MTLQYRGLELGKTYLIRDIPYKLEGICCQKDWINSLKLYRIRELLVLSYLDTKWLYQINEIWE